MRQGLVGIRFFLCWESVGKQTSFEVKLKERDKKG